METFNYIGSLPKVLSEEETKYFMEVKNNGNKNARNKLIEHNLRLVVYVASGYVTHVEKDDLISIGTIGLIKAVDNYKIDQGVRFVKYARKCIENEILMYFRKSNIIITKEVSINESIEDEEFSEKSITILDFLISNNNTEEEIEENDLKEKIPELVDSLKTRDKKIITLVYGFTGEVKTQKEVANILNSSQPAISRSRDKIILKLKRKLEPYVNI